MPYNETPTKGKIMKLFKNTPHTGLKNVHARLTMRNRKDRYKAFLDEYKIAHPEWTPFSNLNTNLHILKTEPFTTPFVDAVAIKKPLKTTHN